MGSAIRWVIGVCASCVLLISALAVVRAAGQPFPGLFVDPYGDFSNVHLPGWETQRLHLSVGDHICIDGPLGDPEFPCTSGSDVDRATRRSFERGARSLSITVQGRAARRQLNVPIRSVGAAEIWWFWGLYVSVAACILWSGLVSHSVAARRTAAHAHLFLSFSAFIFLTTFLDYHTTRWLAPLFGASTVGNAAGLCALAVFFPSPLALPRWARLVLGLTTMLAAASLVLLALDPVIFWNLHGLRAAVTAVSPLPLLILGAVTLLRLRSASGSDRLELVSAAWGIAVAPALVGLAFATVLITGQAFFHVLLPFAVLAFPLSVSYSFIRHNILGSERLVRRGHFAPPALVAGVCAGGSVWAIARESDGSTTAPILAGVVATVAIAGAAWIVIERAAIFSARRFRPTIEKLADALATLRDPEAIRDRLVKSVAELLRTEIVEFREHDDPADKQGERHLSSKLLVIPLRAAGETFGTVLVNTRASRAPFSTQDVQLAETMASFCAQALRNARSLSALEELRDLERTAGSQGRRVTMDLIGAELAHEVAYPLNYFRHFLSRLSAGRGYDESDVEIGKEEVDRLSRMLGSLRSLQLPPQSLTPVRLAVAAERAVALVRAPAEERGLTLLVEVPPHIVVQADFDRTLQLLANLLRNAVQAARDSGVVQLSAQPLPTEAIIEVRDDGPGIPAALRTEVFRPFVSGRSGGSGLGLAVSQRIARSFGWSLDHHREGELTVFRIRATIDVEGTYEVSGR